MNVGLTGDFNLAKLRPIEDIGKLAAIRRLIAGPEAQKEKEENRLILQNVIFSLMEEKGIDADKILVKSNIDTENIRVQQALLNIAGNERLFRSAGITCPLDEWLKGFSLEMNERIHDALVMYLLSLVSSEETERIPLSDFLIGKGVPAWVYSRFALTKQELPQDKPFWSLFFKSSMEKSINFTLKEIVDDSIRDAMEGFPGFAELVYYCEQTKDHFPKKVDDYVKVKLMILPRGLEYDLIQGDLSGARSFVDTTEFKDYSFLWNTSRLGMVGITNPYGDRFALYRSYFGLDAEEDDEKFSFKERIKALGLEFVPDLLKNPNVNAVERFFQHAGIPARLSELARQIGPAVFPGPRKILNKPEEKKGEQVIPAVYHSEPVLGIGNKKDYKKRVIRYVRQKDYSALKNVNRNSDAFRKFEQTPYFQKNLVLKVSISKPRDGGAALSKKALGCVKIVAKTEAVRYLAPAIQNFLSGFMVQEIMDLAADDIINRLRAKEYLAYEDAVEGFDDPNEEDGAFEYAPI